MTKLVKLLILLLLLVSVFINYKQNDMINILKNNEKTMIKQHENTMNMMIQEQKRLENILKAIDCREMRELNNLRPEEYIDKWWEGMTE